MASEDVKTVTIPIDEYFDLRQKAETNIFLMNELGQVRGEIENLHRRINDHERDWHSGK